MIRFNKATLLVIFATTMVIGNTAKAGLLYNVTELGSLGGNYTAPYAINSNGLIVGASQNISGLYQAILWQPNTTTPISLGDGLVNSQALGVNINGIVVGSSNSNAVFWQPGSTIPNYLTTSRNGYAASINSIGQIVGIDNGNAVLWQPGSTLPIILGGGIYGGSALGINNNGQIAGDVFSPTEGALWQSGSTIPTVLNTLGGTYSEANSINNIGQIVGYADTSTGVKQASLWQPGSTTPIALGGGSSDAFSINNNGQIVGYFITGGTQHAALWQPNSLNPIDLNNLVATPSYLKYAFGINDFGQIVAESASGNAYLLTPSTVPIPGALWLFASGLGLLLFNRRRTTQ
jgi:probable HAF family extracellular repeat protein